MVAVASPPPTRRPVVLLVILTACEARQGRRGRRARVARALVSARHGPPLAAGPSFGPAACGAPKAAVVPAKARPAFSTPRREASTTRPLRRPPLVEGGRKGEAPRAATIIAMARAAAVPGAPCAARRPPRPRPAPARPMARSVDGPFPYSLLCITTALAVPCIRRPRLKPLGGVEPFSGASP